MIDPLVLRISDWMLTSVWRRSWLRPLVVVLLVAAQAALLYAAVTVSRMFMYLGVATALLGLAITVATRRSVLRLSIDSTSIELNSRPSKKDFTKLVNAVRAPAGGDRAQLR